MSTSTAAIDSGGGGTELASRVVVSFVACAFVTWQLAETVNWRSDATAVRRRLARGTPLQWYLISLMIMSALDGVVGIVADVMSDSNDVILSAEAVRRDISLQLVLGKLSELILSLMIIGLGVSRWSGGGVGARLATGLGALSLFIRRLPAPLVLVSGVYAMQRTKKVASPTGESAGDGANRCCGCCSLRTALRPLLMLAILEALHGSIVVDGDAARKVDAQKLQLHGRAEAELARHDAQRQLILDMVDARDPAHAAEHAAQVAAAQQAEHEAAENMLAMVDALSPASMIEMVAQQIGELVVYLLVLALGWSGRAHGLKHTLWPIVCVSIPGLPNSFGVVFYFLLDARQAHNGGTILPISAG